MAKKSFAVVPTVDITRSKFLRTSQEKTTMKLGEITPIWLEEVIPGSTHSFSLASLIRMATPVVPIMDNIYMDFYAFYVPNRIIWNHWKEFNGENTSGAGATDPTDYSIPMQDIGDGKELSVGSLGDHLGLPIELTTDECMVSDLPGRAYWLIYNEWFRDQNVESPKVIDLGDSSNDFYRQGLAIAYKFSDYFTRSLPYAQKGGAVSLPLQGSANLAVTGSVQPFGGALKFYDEDNTLITDPSFLGVSSGGKVVINYDGLVEDAPDPYIDNYSKEVSGSNLYVDLSNATAATINQLRFAFQYQKMLEKDAMYGTRYWEILYGHFGVTAPDASLQRPENLGHHRVNISIDQVLQTSATTESGTPLGNPGANSVTGSGYKNLFSKSFTETGYIMVVAVARHDQTYSQGIDRMWSRKSREDFYLPEFANLGAQEVKVKEIYANSSDREAVFGYQEAWAEYRYKPNKVTGCLRPEIDDSMGVWTLGNFFEEEPTLGTTFLKQGRENIGRCLVTGAESDFDFICDFSFVDTAVLPMPMYSLPGLIDHH